MYLFVIKILKCNKKLKIKFNFTYAVFRLPIDSPTLIKVSIDPLNLPVNLYRTQVGRL